MLSLLISLLFSLISVGSSSVAGASEGAMPPDSVQVIRLSITGEGYQPGRLTVKVNVPVQLIVTRTGNAGCGNSVRIPAFGVPLTRIPMNTPTTIRFTPTRTGTFPYLCSMDACHQGVLTVRS